MGLFKPIWMTDNSYKLDKAIAFVNKTEDQEQLKRIAMEAPLEEVGDASVNRIEDPYILKHIALYARPTLAQTAIEKISDTDLLKHLAMEYDDVRSETACRKISHTYTQQELADLIKNSKSSNVRILAAEIITDSEIAHDVIGCCGPEEAKAALVPLIHDEELLKKLLISARGSILTSKIQEQLAKLEDEKLRRIQKKLETLYSCIREDPGNKYLSLTCPECNGEMICLADSEYNNQQDDSYHYVFWMKCENCGFHTPDSRKPDFRVLTPTIVSSPPSGNISICPVCRKRRMTAKERYDMSLRYVFGIGPEESCRCSNDTATEYPPVLMKIWDLYDYKRRAKSGL